MYYILYIIYYIIHFIIYTYSFSFISIFFENCNSIRFDMFMYTEIDIETHRIIQKNIYNTKHTQNTKLHFQTVYFPKSISRIRHSFESAFSAYFDGPLLAGLEFQYIYIYIYLYSCISNLSMYFQLFSFIHSFITFREAFLSAFRKSFQTSLR